eukprot:2238261-Rhodomonas_salina.3
MGGGGERASDSEWRRETGSAGRGGTGERERDTEGRTRIGIEREERREGRRGRRGEGGVSRPDIERLLCGLVGARGSEGDLKAGLGARHAT